MITSAEILSAQMRKTIEEAFRCPVFDHYGAREIGVIASACEEYCGYHLTAKNVVMEIIRNGEPVVAEESGVILLTGLHNHGMPLIRYKIGDIGALSQEICNCGHGLPLMRSIEGRESQILVVRDKGSKMVLLDTSIIEYIMFHLRSPLESYRLIQESLDHVVVKIVKGKYHADDYTELMVKQLRSYLGRGVQVDVQFVKTLPPLPSGKRSTLISKVKFFDSY